MSALFGPAGNDDQFAALKYKGTLDIPKYVSSLGLTAYEYQCGRGVNIGSEKAAEFGVLAKEKGIKLSLHAPYYISMSGIDKEKRLNSVNYILASAEAVNAMGGDRIVVHTGSCGKISREQALDLAKDTMKIALDTLDERGLGHIHICPETMGKINQLGTLYEVMELCKLDERLIPCIDFGHLNARTRGELVADQKGYEKILDTIKNELGEYRHKNFHSHFSKIEYTEGGEKCHLTFADEVFGPFYEPLMELVAKRDLSPTFICESAGTQGADALAMMNSYTKYREKLAK